MMTLYGYWRSSASYRVRIALALKGVEVKHVAVNLREGEQGGANHAKRNAQPFVPVLELEDGTRLTQSLAILDFLDATFPDYKLMSDDAVTRSKMLAASLIIASDISPIQNLSVLKYIRAEHGADDAGVKSWAAHWISRGFTALEKTVADNSQDFYLSDKPAFYECCLIPQIYNARRFGVDMDRFPTLRDIDARCAEIEAFNAAAPEVQHDAP